MNIYLREEDPDLLHLYYTVNDAQFTYIVNHQYNEFPVRFFKQEKLCMFLNIKEAYKAINENLCLKSQKTDTRFHILRFLVKKDLIKKYLSKNYDYVNSVIIPNSDLQLLNQSIIGRIERIETMSDK